MYLTKELQERWVEEVTKQEWLKAIGPPVAGIDPTETKEPQEPDDATTGRD